MTTLPFLTPPRLVFGGRIAGSAVLIVIYVTIWPAAAAHDSLSNRRQGAACRGSVTEPLSL
jgi:hypothetical protein